MSIDTFLAYIGPGLGAGAVAAVLGVIGSIFLGIFAVLWYPIKRIIKKTKKNKVASTETTAASTASTPSATASSSEAPSSPQE